MGPVGIIDIGSNSIRLVVFARPSRALQPIFNEKVLCGLGRGIGEANRLNPEGVHQARQNLARFAAMARALGVERLDAYATAAVREAVDGPAFLDAVQAESGLSVRILSGEEEARMSALGVVSAIPDADGVIGDLGGGSLELVSVHDRTAGDHVTLPLGPFRLMRETKPAAAIDRHLARLGWLKSIAGRSFYPVGGAWRAIARLHMAHASYPLQVIHHYAVERAEMEAFATLVARQSRKSLQRLPGVPRRRLEMLPYAAQVMARLLHAARPKRVVFSAYGLREGLVYDALTEAEQRRDPLIETVIDIARAGGRFAVNGAALARWLDPICRDDPPEVARLREAAAWLGDVSGLEHPDHRGELAYFRALYTPGVGIDHPGRAFLALALAARYEGTLDLPFTDIARRALPAALARQALVAGLGLRLAFAVGAGVPSVLREAVLERDGSRLRLVLSPAARALDGEVVQRRLGALAEVLGVQPAVVLSR